MATIHPFPHRPAPDLSWRPAVAARVDAWRLRRRVTRAARALVALVLGCFR